jgi:nucleoside-diphosphate-sugar epimerase
MKILITGANGFIGNNLFKLLSNKYTVTGIFGRKDIDLIKFEHVKKLLNNNYDIVIHCATAGRYETSSIDTQILNDNLEMFLNFSYLKDRFKRFINIGSGAEFDLSTNIDNVSETEIFNRTPTFSYGLSKNLISKQIYKLDNFYTLRIFGCISTSSPSNTLIYNFTEQVSQGHTFKLVNDRYFDFFSMYDLISVIEHYIIEENLKKDVNLTYDNKIKISDILKSYLIDKNLSSNLLEIVSESQINYTGNNKSLNTMNITLSGLENILRKIK